MRTYLVLAELAVSALAMTVADQAPAGASDNDKIQGSWVVTSLTSDGVREGADSARKMRLVFRENKYRFTGGDSEYEGTFKLDASKKPKTIDATESRSEDKTVDAKGIYALEGDKLTIAWSEPGSGERPTELASKAGSKVRLIVLEREKKGR